MASPVYHPQPYVANQGPMPSLDSQIQQVYSQQRPALDPGRYKHMTKPHLEAELKQKDNLILDLRDTIEVLEVSDALDIGTQASENATTLATQTRKNQSS